MTDAEFKHALAVLVDYVQDMARRRADDDMIANVDAFITEAIVRGLIG